MSKIKTWAIKVRTEELGDFVEQSTKILYELTK